MSRMTITWRESLQASAFWRGLKRAAAIVGEWVATLSISFILFVLMFA